MNDMIRLFLRQRWWLLSRAPVGQPWRLWFPSDMPRPAGLAWLPPVFGSAAAAEHLSTSSLPGGPDLFERRHGVALHSREAGRLLRQHLGHLPAEFFDTRREILRPEFCPPAATRKQHVASRSGDPKTLC